MAPTPARVAHAFDVALVVAAVAVVGVGFVSWAFEPPIVSVFTVIVLLTCAVILGTLLRGEDPTTARVLEPGVLGVSLATIVSQHPEQAGQGLLPVWAVVVLVTHRVALRVRFTEVLPRAALLVVGGQVLVLVAEGTDLGLRPNDQVVVGLLAYTAVVLLLFWIREQLHGDPLLPDGSVRTTLWLLLGAVGYAGCLMAALNIYYVNPDHPWVTVGVTAACILVTMVVWLLTSTTRLRNVSETLMGAARATPWPIDEVDSLMTRLVSDHLRVESVAVEKAAGGEGTISEQVTRQRWLVARRQRGDVPFTDNDERLVGSVAALGRASYLQADRERKLREEAITDELTGLSEYKHWRTILTAFSAERVPGELIGVVFFDLDYFKEINETYGHLRADIVLEMIGHRLKGFSSQWRFARFGGDEFVGMIRNVRDQRRLDELCDELAAVVGEPVSAHGKVITTTATVGRTISADADEHVSRIVARADNDLRRRKSQRSERGDAPSDRELVRGVLEGGLRVAFQPVFKLPERTVHGWEALLRGELPGRGAVPPTELIEAARRLGALDAITLKLAQQAIATVDEACRRLGRRMHVSVNIESDQLQWGNEILAWFVGQARITRAGLVLEITERGDAEWGEEEYELAEDLSAQGIGLTLDDYGAGQSRLRAVARRHWDFVKMDRDFLTTATAGLALLRHNVDAMHELGQVVVLEGLEDEHLVDLAEALGIDYGQGYWLGRPVAADELLAGLDELPLPPDPQGDARDA